MIEKSVNSIPIGYLYHGSGGNNPLLRILTPNSLRLISAGDRAPAGLFKIPNSVGDIMEDIEHKYLMWYEIWNTSYLPLIMQRQKWHFSFENVSYHITTHSAVVWFKLQRL